MASCFTPHPLFLSHPLSKQPSSKPTPAAAQPPEPPTPPSQPPSQTPLRVANSPEQQPPIILQKEVETSSNTNSTKKSSSNNVESTDWIASSLTRRFGLGAGLAWAGFLAVGVISEQIKTRLEISQQEANTRDVEKEEEVVLPNGISYYEMRVGGGATPRTGDLVVLDLRGSIKGSGEEFVDTFGGGNKKKPLALVMGSRPYTRGMCEGIEYVLKTMKAGGKRRVIVPPNLGFGEKGADFGSGVVIPPNATLEYIVEVERVSIAPA